MVYILNICMKFQNIHHYYSVYYFYLFFIYIIYGTTNNDNILNIKFIGY